MKILKYKKIKSNEYKITTDKKEFNLYDDLIIKYELLLKKEISDKELDNILSENNLLKAYYEGIKAINIKMRSPKELETILKRKEYKPKEIEYTLTRLKEEKYIDNKTYIEAYIHDKLTFTITGPKKILNDLISLGFKESEVDSFLNNIDKAIYLKIIEKYILKKLKSNKKSKVEFKKKTLLELINKGFYKEDIIYILDNIEIEENKESIYKDINKQYEKYLKKYDQFTARLKIKNYIYQKGYSIEDLDSILEHEY